MYRQGAPAAGDEFDHVRQEQAEGADLVRLVRDQPLLVEERSPYPASRAADGRPSVAMLKVTLQDRHDPKSRQGLSLESQWGLADMEHNPAQKLTSKAVLPITPPSLYSSNDEIALDTKLWVSALTAALRERTVVAQHCGAVFGGQHVVRVDVAVADAAGVHVLQRGGHVSRRAQHKRRGQPAALAPAAAQQRHQVGLLRETAPMHLY